MRLFLLLIAFILPALADPFQYSVNGVGYSWNYDPGSNTSGTIQVQFSAPISYYQFTLDFPTVENPQIWVNSVSPSAINVNWSYPSGPYIHYGAVATVFGRLPDSTSLNVTISGVARSPLFPLGLTFSELVDPPAGGGAAVAQADAPEPSTLALICAGLACSILMNRSDHAKLYRLSRRT